MDRLQVLPPSSARSNAIYGQTGSTFKALRKLMFLSVQINHAFDSFGWRYGTFISTGNYSVELTWYFDQNDVFDMQLTKNPAAF